MLIAS
jgi:hypothetical protein